MLPGPKSALPAPVAPGPGSSQRGQRGSEMEVERERFISGEDILKRWKGAPFELVDAMLSGELIAIDKKTSDRHVQENDRCFFCNQNLQGDGFDICIMTEDEFERGVHYYHTIDEVHYYVRYCRDVSPGMEIMTNEYRTAYRVEIAMQSDFFMHDVEAYEQAHGLGPRPHKPATAEALAETLRAAGITDAGMIARMVKAAFPETTLPEIGALVTGKPDDKGNRSANTKAAQRALKSK